jgi:hypothetical protein
MLLGRKVKHSQSPIQEWKTVTSAFIFLRLKVFIDYKKIMFYRKIFLSKKCGAVKKDRQIYKKKKKTFFTKVGGQ